MAIIKNGLKSEFSQIPNALVLDKTLSNGAKMVAIYLFTKPALWAVNNQDIMNSLGICKPHTLSGYWKELLVAGWVTRVKKRDDGKFAGGYDYTINQIAQYGQYDDTRMPINGNAENRQCAKMGIHSNMERNNNTDIYLDDFSKEDDFERFWSVYPKRFGGNPRKPAKERFLMKIKQKIVTAEQMIFAAEQYHKDMVKLKLVNTERVKQAVTWINQHCWEEYLEKEVVNKDKIETKKDDFLIYIDYLREQNEKSEQFIVQPMEIYSMEMNYIKNKAVHNSFYIWKEGMKNV